MMVSAKQFYKRNFEKQFDQLDRELLFDEM